MEVVEAFTFQTEQSKANSVHRRRLVGFSSSIAPEKHLKCVSPFLELTMRLVFGFDFAIRHCYWMHAAELA